MSQNPGGKRDKRKGAAKTPYGDQTRAPGSPSQHAPFPGSKLPESSPTQPTTSPVSSQSLGQSSPSPPSSSPASSHTLAQVTRLPPGGSRILPNTPKWTGRSMPSSPVLSRILPKSPMSLGENVPSSPAATSISPKSHGRSVPSSPAHTASRPWEQSAPSSPISQAAKQPPQANVGAALLSACVSSMEQSSSSTLPKRKPQGSRSSASSDTGSTAAPSNRADGSRKASAQIPLPGRGPTHPLVLAPSGRPLPVRTGVRAGKFRDIQRVASPKAFGTPPLVAFGAGRGRSKFKITKPLLPSKTPSTTSSTADEEAELEESRLQAGIRGACGVYCFLAVQAKSLMDMAYQQIIPEEGKGKSCGETILANERTCLKWSKSGLILCLVTRDTHYGARILPWIALIVLGCSMRNFLRRRDALYEAVPMDKMSYGSTSLPTIYMLAMISGALALYVDAAPTVMYL